MKFIADIRNGLGWTHYKLARELNLPVNCLIHLEEKGQKIDPGDLCRIRSISGLSWSALGKILEKEFLE